MNYHAALIYAMVLGAAADNEISETELVTIRDIIGILPIFEDFEEGNLNAIAGAAMELLTEDDGLDAAIGLIRDQLPEKLRDTAYALACDVVAADRVATQQELQYLKFLRDGLNIDLLTAAAIERGAAARYATV